MMKGITPIIAIIVLLLITIALAGTAWTYLSGYMQGLTGTSLELRDAFCIAGDTPVIIVANTGTATLNVADISITNMGTGEVISSGAWYDPTDISTTIATIPVNGLGRWNATAACTSGTLCNYRITGGTARAQTARIQC